MSVRLVADEALGILLVVSLIPVCQRLANEHLPPEILDVLQTDLLE